MRYSGYSIAAFVVLAGLLTTQPASAGVLLSALLAGDSIQVEDKLFNNWTLEVNTISGDDSLGRTAFNLANIDVQPWAGDPYNPGLVFNPLNDELTITQAGVIPVNSQLVFRFDVNVLDPWKAWHDNELEFTFSESAETGTDDRTAHIHEFLFGNFLDPLTQFADKDVHRIHDDGVPVDLIKLTDSATFAPRAFGTVLKDISMEVHTNGESIGITQFQQHFSQIPVPEPGTLTVWSILGLVVGAGAIRRRRRDQSAD